MPEVARQPQPTNPKHIPTPSELAAAIKRTVVGQDAAIEAIATILRAHSLRSQGRASLGPHAPAAANPFRAGPILLMGPTGCGKTYITKTGASLTRCVFSIEDATAISEVGYYGRDIASVITSLLMASQSGPTRPTLLGAETAILMIDEFDKTRMCGGLSFRSGGTGLDVSREGTQRSILTLLDGSPLQVQLNGRDGRREISFRTDGLLTIIAGSFAGGLAAIVDKRLGGGRRRIGFGRTAAADQAMAEADLLKQASPEDLVQFGLLPEIVGRLTDTIVLDDLSRDALRRILLDTPEGPLWRVQRQAEAEGFAIRITDRLADAIADDAVASGLGARWLNGAVARMTRRCFYEMPDKIVKRRSAGAVTVELDLPALVDGSFSVLRPRRQV